MKAEPSRLIPQMLTATLELSMGALSPWNFLIAQLKLRKTVLKRNLQVLAFSINASAII